MRITDKTSEGQAQVYDIGLENHHNFLLGNGAVASNCFNKAHSVSYSILTYITAYLKANYPSEFFCSLMTVRSKTLQPKTWALKAPEYIQEAKKLGVEINPPSVNGSDLDFTIKDNEIYFGLNAIRDVGKTAARCIVSARGRKSFLDVFDFLDRVNLQKVTTKTFQSLIYAGAFDKLGYDRKDLLEKSTDLYDYVKNILEFHQRKADILEREKKNSELSLLIEKRNTLRKEIKSLQRVLKKCSDKLEISKINNSIESLEQELTPLEEMKLRKMPALKEKSIPEKPELLRDKNVALNLNQIMEQAHYIGCYVSTHPAQLISNGCEKLADLWTGQRARVCGIVNNLKIIKTKKGQTMAFMEIDDSTAVADVVIFPQLWNKVGSSDLQVGALVHIDVKVQSEQPDLKVIGEKITIHKEI